MKPQDSIDEAIKSQSIIDVQSAIQNHGNNSIKPSHFKLATDIDQLGKSPSSSVILKILTQAAPEAAKEFGNKNTTGNRYGITRRNPLIPDSHKPDLYR